jgi:acyl-CoA synthetase (NDP forming)
MAILAKPDIIAQYEAEGAAVFDEAMRAMRCLRALARLGTAPALPPDAPFEQAHLALPEGRAPNEDEAKALLAAAGLRRPRESLAGTPREAANAARAIGGRLAVKIVSADIPHKTEVGGVALDLATPEAVAEAVQRMAAEVPPRAPGARIDGYLVSEMIGGGVEMIVGARHDPVFGPVVLLGLGGIFVEVLRDVVMRLAPVSDGEARAMIDELRGAALLHGARGSAPADVEALARALAAVSRLATDPRIASIEVNPLRVMPRGGGVVMLDALIETAGEEARNA